MIVVKLALSRLSLRKSNKAFRAMVVFMVFLLGLPGGMIAGTSAIKDEIENGPNRALNQMAPNYWVLQKGSTNVITSSFVPRTLVDRLNQLDGIEAAGVVRDFRPVTKGDESREAIIYSYNPELPQMRPSLVEGSQATAHGVVIDVTLAKALGVGVGDEVGIAGLKLSVDGITSGTSAIGKEGVFMPEAVINTIAPTSDYTVVLVNRSPGAKLPAWLYQDYSTYTNQQFMDLNSEYWRVNASKLAETLILSSTAFALIIMFISLLVYLFMQRKQLALIRATGATVFQAWLTELLYLTVIATASVLVQVVVAHLVVGMANANTPGFMGELSASNIKFGFMRVMCIALGVGGTVGYVYIKWGLRKKRLMATLVQPM